MKKNINVNSMPTIKVEVSQAPVEMKDWAKSQGLNLAVVAATTLVTGVIGALCTRLGQSKPKKVKTGKSVEEVIEEAVDSAE